MKKLKFYKVKLKKFKTFSFQKKYSANLEQEGQGHGIIMGVTRLLLLEPVYYIAHYWSPPNINAGSVSKIGFNFFVGQGIILGHLKVR